MLKKVQALKDEQILDLQDAAEGLEAGLSKGRPAASGKRCDHRSPADCFRSGCHPFLPILGLEPSCVAITRL